MKKLSQSDLDAMVADGAKVEVTKKAPLPIASSGYLYLVSDVVEAGPQGGGGSKGLHLSAHGRRLLREDEEIMAVIMAATRMLQ